MFLGETPSQAVRTPRELDWTTVVT